MKVGPSRLREVTTSEDVAPARESLGRASKNKQPIVESSGDEGAAEDSKDEDVGSLGESEDEEMEDEEEDEDDDDERDGGEGDVRKPVVMAGPAPKIRISAPGAASTKPLPETVIKAAPRRSVEEKEMGMPPSSDNDLSDAVSVEGMEDEEDEDEDEEDDLGESDEDMEMEMDMDMGMQMDMELDDVSSMPGEGGSSSGTPTSSRAGTPDPTKQTRRQRAENESLMALSNEAQKKKFFTQEQITMRKMEMARRRKDLSERRNKEEKADTLNRLLHKQAPKRRSRAQILADQEREERHGTTPGFDDDGEPMPSAAYARTIIRSTGTRVGVPQEWLGTMTGQLFEGAQKSTMMQRDGWPRLVEEVD